ncbi:MAG: Abi family protein [Christensenellales bacterium]
MNTRSKKYFPVKPARSYEEQLTRLSEIHDLTIGDPDRARYILSTVNYYRLTTYGKHLRRADDPEKFQPGVTLETLFGLYQFDMNLRHLLLPVLEFLRCSCAPKSPISWRLRMVLWGIWTPKTFGRKRWPTVRPSIKI